MVAVSLLIGVILPVNLTFKIKKNMISGEQGGEG